MYDIDIFDAAEEYFAEVKAPVLELDFIRDMKKRYGIDREEVDEYIQEELLDNWSKLVVYLDGKKAYFQMIDTLYNGRQFFIEPSDYEIEMGILIHGDRFLPFSDDGRDITSLRLSHSNGKRIVKKKLDLKIEDLVNSTAFFTPESAEIVITSYKNLDDSFRTREFFNLNTFYKTYRFNQGDKILVTVEDWEDNTFSIEHISKSTYSEKYTKSESWYENIDTAFNALFKEYASYQYQTLSKQMANILLRCSTIGSESLERPLVNPVDYYHRNSSIGILEMGFDAMFWPVGVEIPAYLTEDDDDEEDWKENNKDEYECGLNMVNSMLGEMTANSPLHDDMDFFSGMTEKANDASLDLEGLLATMGFSLDEDEVEAFVRDEFYTGRKSFDKLMLRCFDDRVQRLFPYLETEFNKKVRAVWTRVKKDYNKFRDDNAGQIRHEALKGIENQLLWIREIDNTGLTTADVPDHKIQEVGHMTSMLANCVSSFNEDDLVSNEQVEEHVPLLVNFNVDLKFLMDGIISDLRKRKE